MDDKQRILLSKIYAQLGKLRSLIGDAFDEENAKNQEVWQENMTDEEIKNL